MPRAPQKINNYLIFDVETGGLDKKEGLHSKKVPITEFAGIGINGVTLEEILRYENIVKPYSTDLQYQPEAAAITGLTKERCEKEGVPLRQLVDDICQLLEETNIYKSKVAKPILVSHNFVFDRQFIMDAFIRAKVDLSKYVDGAKDAYGNFVPTGIDSIHLAKMLWAETTDTDSNFRLETCVGKAGIDMADAHRAINDCIPLADLLRYVITRLRSGSSEVTVVDGKATSIRNKFEW